MTHVAPPGDRGGVADGLVLDWLAGLVAGEAAEIGEIDDDTYAVLARHRLAPLAAAHGGRHAALAEAQRTCFVRTSAIERATGACVDLLAGEGIPAVALKGPALAAAYWGDPLVRESGDADVLVAEGDLTAACRALLAAGFVERRLYPSWYLRAWHYHRCFVAPGPAVTVELHWRFCRPYLYRAVRRSPLDGPDSVACLTRSLPAPAAAWQLLIAATHAVLHDFGLRALLDVAFIARRLSPDQWAGAVARAREACLEPSLYFATTISARRLGWTPPAIIADLRPGPVRDAVSDAYIRRLARSGLPGTLMVHAGKSVLPLMSTSGPRLLSAELLSLTDRPRVAHFLARRADASIAVRPPRPFFRRSAR